MRNPKDKGTPANPYPTVSEAARKQLLAEDEDPLFQALYLGRGSRSTVRQTLARLDMLGYVLVKKSDLPQPTPTRSTGLAEAALQAASVRKAPNQTG